MKQLLAIVLATLSLTVFAAEPQKVCIDKIGKDGKPQQECKMMKVHKKLEVEEVKKK